MVLEREDDRILGGLESTLGDGLDYILQEKQEKTRTCVQLGYTLQPGGLRPCSERQHQKRDPPNVTFTHK